MKVLLLSQIATVDYKYTYSLANALKACGNEIELVIDDKKDNDYCQCKCYRKFLTSRKDIGKVKKLVNYIISYNYLVNKAIKEQFQIVHIQWISFPIADYWFLKKLQRHGIKVIISVHDILPFNIKSNNTLLYRKIYGICSEIIVQAKKNIDRFVELFPECHDKVTYIPHGNFIDFVEAYDKEKAKDYLQIPKEKFVLLFFGQIKKVKGVGVLLEAFGQLIQKRSDVVLVIAGNVWKDNFGIYQDIIDKYKIHSYNLKMDISFIPDKEVGYYYSACDIAILPYLDVYQSGVIQLAYSYGKPVIATKLDSFKEIVEDGKNGFLCEPNNSDNLLLTIEKAIENMDSLSAMGEYGRNKIISKYSWIDIGKKITEIYKNCL